MAVQFPNVNGKAYDFASVEITLGTSPKIYTAFSNISYSQEVEEGEVRGTAAEPLQRTRGKLAMGEGELEWDSLEEAQSFIDDLGDGYLEKPWTATIVFSTEGVTPFKHELFGCRLLNIEDDHGEGEDPLGETMSFSFMRMERNGRTALINQRR